MTKKILVVDDQVLLGELAARVLTAAGYDVQIACSAGQAEKAFLHQRPDLLLTDLHMPDRDGLELTRWCRDRHPTLITVLMGGLPTAELIVEYGMVNASLQKPFTSAELLHVIRQQLGEL